MSRSGKSIVVLVLCCTSIALLAHSLHFRSLFHGNCLDDAYISFRYATNFAGGEGLVFNGGERVEGYSNFLWVLLLTPFAKLGDLTLPSQLLGILFSIATLLLGVWALRVVFELDEIFYAAFCACFLATSGYIAGWAVAGLEGALHGLLLLAAWALFSLESQPEVERFPYSAFCFAALALSRPEGLFLALGAILFHLTLARVRKKPLLSREIVRFPFIVCGILLPYEFWRFVYYGPHIFPNSVVVKLGGGIDQFQRGAGQVLENFCLPYLPLILLPLILVRWNLKRIPYIFGNGLLGGYLIFIACAGGDWSWGRFFAPLLPLGCVVMLGSLAGTSWPAALRKQPWLRLTAISVSAVYLGFCFYITSVEREMAHRRTYAALDAERIAIGKWLRQEADSETVIAVYAAGQIPYYSGLYTHDMLGLTDPVIARREMESMGSGGAGHEKYDAAYTLETVRPGIIIGGRYIPEIRDHPLYVTDYVDVPRWRANNVRIHRHLLGR